MRHAVLFLGLALAGCSILEPQRDPSRFFTLSAVELDGATPPPASPIALGLGPVRVPSYLDRPELATRIATSELVFSPTDRWAEPLTASIRRVLGQHLSALLGVQDIVTFPWPVGTQLDFAVAVDVLRFERTPAADVEVAARWLVREGGSSRVSLARESRVVQKATGTGTEAAVDAWDKALATLARDIAAGIASLGAARGDGTPTPR